MSRFFIGAVASSMAGSGTGMIFSVNSFTDTSDVSENIVLHPSGSHVYC